jgi:hypothetical protein
VPSSHYARLWAQRTGRGAESGRGGIPARRPALGPYDLRHAAASLWLNASVVATEVARRLRHGVAVLLNVYANCINGQGELANDRIEAALRGPM